MRHALAVILRKAADRLEPPPPSQVFHLRGVYYDGRHFVLTDPAITLYAYTKN